MLLYYFLPSRTDSPHCWHSFQGQAIPKRYCSDTSRHLVSVSVHMNSPSSDARSQSRSYILSSASRQLLMYHSDWKLTFSKCQHTSPPLQQPAIYIYSVALQCEDCVKVFYVLRTYVPRKIRVSHIPGNYRQLANTSRQTLQPIFQHASHLVIEEFCHFC